MKNAPSGAFFYGDAKACFPAGEWGRAYASPDKFMAKNPSALRNNRLQFAKSRSRAVFVKFRIFSRLMT
ncbi:hypothetical protein KJB25_23780, partial [Serratia marcescens]|uniref:hypothetical protein n=1 Tax=Serratia marcescens TaxID=615 RepID=UPI001BDDB541